MSNLCSLKPISAFQSTNLSSQIDCFKDLGERILRMLGHPMINVELHPDQLYDAISMSCEFFTKYAGHKKEYIIFNSNLYEHNKGIRVDNLYTVANTGFTPSQRLAQNIAPNVDFEVGLRGNLYICMSAVPSSYFLSSSALSSVVPADGLSMLQILSETDYASMTAYSPALVQVFQMAPGKPFNIQCTDMPDVKTFNNMFDYDIMDYRKVIDVVNFEEGSSSGITSLFSLEATMAQQTFYSYAMGNFGFDLLSWHAVKDWQKTREKVLAIRRDSYFDNRTQYLRFIPQPKLTSPFVGVLECYVEKPLRDIIKEPFILKYATALSKVMWGRILTKISGVQLLGSGTLNGDSVLAEGLADVKELETFLIEGGYGDFENLGMFIG